MSAPTRITIAGIGAVSPAGWGMAPLLELMKKGSPPPLQLLARPGPDPTRTLPVLRVPKAPVPPPFPAHPRLRRSSPISQFAAAAALEALQSHTPFSTTAAPAAAAANAASASADGSPSSAAAAPAPITSADTVASPGANISVAAVSAPAPDPASPNARTGIIFTLVNGCVNYSNRFYSEVLRDPPTASPILFPETVFNAPASHLATLLGTPAPAFTLLGDSAQFIPGLELAAQWLLDGLVDRCLVVGAEEIDPLTAEALHLLSPGIPASEGAAAILLERNGPGPLLQQIAGPIPISGPPSRLLRANAAARLRQEILTLPVNTLLIDDLAQPDTAKPDAARHSPAPSNPAQPVPAGANPEQPAPAPPPISRADLPTHAAWQDWTGPRLSPRRLLGEAPGASTALQCVLAVHAILSGKNPAALTVSTGGDQQASALLLTL